MAYKKRRPLTTAPAALMRERQDLPGEWQVKDKLLAAARTQDPAKRTADAEKALAARLAAINARVTEINQRMGNNLSGRAGKAGARLPGECAALPPP